MRFSIRFAYQFVSIIIVSIILSSCKPSSEPNYAAPTSSPAALSPTLVPEALPTTTPRPAVSIASPARSASKAVAAFRDAGLPVIAQKTESLDQDWFPGTEEAVSFYVCSSCKKSYVFHFDNKADYDYAHETYSMSWHTYGNLNRVLLIIHSGSDADIANDYGAAFGSRQSH